MTRLKDTKYNLKKGLVILGLGAMTLAFTNCEKDNDKPGNGNNQQQKTTYTYYYDGNGIPQDTVLAHSNVDTFYVLPTDTRLFETWPENTIHNIVTHLQNRSTLTKNMRGKEDFVTLYANPSDSAFLSNFGYNVKRR